jgi:hypothetical protein
MDKKQVNQQERLAKSLILKQLLDENSRISEQVS